MTKSLPYQISSNNKSSIQNFDKKYYVLSEQSSSVCNQKNKLYKKDIKSEYNTKLIIDYLFANIDYSVFYRKRIKKKTKKTLWKNKKILSFFLRIYNIFRFSIKKYHCFKIIRMISYR